MIKLTLDDNEFPFKGFNHTRNVARGIVFFEDGKIAIHTIHRDDIFGCQTYYETPGGGVDDGETPAMAVVRECEEELGYLVEAFDEIGIVEDAYNLIGRKNINTYFACFAKEKTKKHFESEGDTLIIETKHYSLEEAISLFESQNDRLVAGLVKRRELPILKEALSKMPEWKDKLDSFILSK